MGAEIKAPSGTGPYCFSIHGQIYHMVSPLYSNERNKPGYGQYIFDSSEATVNVKMVFMEHPDLDLSRYNGPTSRTEVATIFVGDDGEPPANQDICIYPSVLQGLFEAKEFYSGQI
ncbi:hypothetical protein AVEN_4033-1 [Araneus ventricosus]|uniref:Uncharacterized protein n=1 Tax=Araneus ventricosus TaxID=182803 RepID=A0A4Y2J502_ARAVE|nr:hypothetical protein AVEN_4033-1 [Araneus ventricosus]